MHKLGRSAAVGSNQVRYEYWNTGVNWNSLSSLNYELKTEARTIHTTFDTIRSRFDLNYYNIALNPYGINRFFCETKKL